MKLSEAMMLGSTTCKMVPTDWNSCALGCAANAIGIANFNPFDPLARVTEISKAWPWLDEPSSTGCSTKQVGYWPWLDEPPTGCCAIIDIFTKFDHQVCTGRMTFEALVDYVRSIEPDCGECNRFTCTCVKTQIEQTEGVTVERSA